MTHFKSMSCMDQLRCTFKEVFNTEGLDLKPNTNLVNRRIERLKSPFLTSWHYKNLKKS